MGYSKDLEKKVNPITNKKVRHNGMPRLEELAQELKNAKKPASRRAF
jgi:hypothetical protein